MSSNKMPKKVLLCVAGLSPQIVTETLYVLAVKQKWVPDEVHVITTKDGSEQVIKSLLSQDLNWFEKLCHDYKLKKIKFTQENIFVIKDKNGKELEDIRTIEDNQFAADSIANYVRHLTSIKNSELHVSIAGGRKTMGFYLGYALSLYGRKKDQLSHVLVSAPFESSWEFFYPTKVSKIIKVRSMKGERLVDCKDAIITLANIPYVRMRHLQAREILNSSNSYSDVVASTQETLFYPDLIINQKTEEISINGKTICLTASSLALLSVFARRKKQEKPRVKAPKSNSVEWAHDFLQEYRNIKGQMGSVDRAEAAINTKQGMPSEYFSQKLSNLRKELKSKLGYKLARPLLIDDGNTRPKQYQLLIQAENIHFK